MAASTTELKQLLLRYTSEYTGADRLREVLQATSVEDRYEALLSVKGCGGFLAAHQGAAQNDVTTIKHMMGGFTSDQQYNIVGIQGTLNLTALHLAAVNKSGDTAMVMYLLRNIPMERRYNLLRKQNHVGSTALHAAATHNHMSVLQVMLTSVSSDQQKMLLSIKDNENKAIADLISLPKLAYDVAAWTRLEMAALQERHKIQAAELDGTKQELTALKESHIQQEAVIAAQARELHDTKQRVNSMKQELNGTKKEAKAVKKSQKAQEAVVARQHTELQQLRDNQTEMLRMIADLQISLGMCFSTGDTSDQENEC